MARATPVPKLAVAVPVRAARKRPIPRQIGVKLLAGRPRVAVPPWAARVGPTKATAARHAGKDAGAGQVGRTDVVSAVVARFAAAGRDKLYAGLVGVTQLLGAA